MRDSYNQRRYNWYLPSQQHIRLTLKSNYHILVLLLFRDNYRLYQLHSIHNDLMTLFLFLILYFSHVIFFRKLFPLILLNYKFNDMYDKHMGQDFHLNSNFLFHKLLLLLMRIIFKIQRIDLLLYYKVILES